MDPVFGQLSFDNHEQIVFCHDKYTGLKAIIGIHNTVMGPALGGTRMWKYNNEWEALNDVLRLSRGMTYKSAITGLNLGGGKAVITTTDATITRDTSQQFKFEIDVVITAGSTSETVTFTVTVPTGLSNVTMVKN